MQWHVTGDDRQVGALGAPDRFEITVEAGDREEAYLEARRVRYAEGREHVHIYRAREVR